MKLKYLFFLLWLVFSADVFANPSWYQVEVILFTHNNAKFLHEETWPQKNIVEPSLKNSVTLAPPDITLPPPSGWQEYQTLPSSRFVLNQVYDKMMHSSRYLILAHIAWIQRLQAPKDTKNIHLTAGKLYSTLSESETTDLAIKEGSWELDGTLQVNLQTNIFLYTNLMLTLPNSLINVKNEESGFSKFPLNITERLQLKKLYYVDHPLFGMLVMIVPFK